MQFSEYTFAFNLKPIFWVSVAGVVIYFLLYVISRFVVPLLTANRPRSRTQVILPVIDRVLWALFTIVAAFAITIPNPFSGGIIVIAMMAGAWFFIRNYLAGLFMLIGGDFKIGQKVRIDGYSGSIATLKRLTCEIELDNGELLSISYTEFTSKPVIKTAPSEKVLSHTIVLHIPKPCDIGRQKEKLLNKLLAMPWLLPGEIPVVEVTDESKEDYTVTVVVVGIDKRQLEKVEKAIT